ncbi:MAG: molybdenum cofactor guanylyltransferase [Terracidiphilus sp.]
MSPPHFGSDNKTADAFILAGGRSTRMGQDKALVPLAGNPLIERALTILSSAGFEPRIAGAKSDLSSFAPTLLDKSSESGLGPLAGICSALASSTARYGLFLSIDLPLLPSSLVDYLLELAIATESAITGVSIAGFVQTFPVVIDRAGLPVLQSILRSNDRNCLRAFRAAADSISRPFSIQPVEVLIQSGQVMHPQGFAAAEWFLNVNSPVELARAETLLGPEHLQVS